MRTRSYYQSYRVEHGVLVLSNTEIKSWEQWPEDVREHLRKLNKRGALSFRYASKIYKCLFCDTFIDPFNSTVCVVKGVKVCDDCVIRLVRN